MAGVLSFDFSKVEVSSGPNIGDIPVGVPLNATIDTIEAQDYNGVTKFVFNQTVYIDGEQGVNFKTFIGPKHGWLLAQYLQAVGEDFRSLSGEAISAEALTTIMVGHPIVVVLKESTYKTATGEERTSKQITTVKEFTE